MLLSGEQIQRAAKEIARANPRLQAELRPFHDFRQFFGALQRTLAAVAIHEGVSSAGRVAWKILRALRVEGD